RVRPCTQLYQTNDTGVVNRRPLSIWSWKYSIPEHRSSVPDRCSGVLGDVGSSQCTRVLCAPQSLAQLSAVVVIEVEVVGCGTSSRFRRAIVFDALLTLDISVWPRFDVGMANVESDSCEIRIVVERLVGRDFPY